MAYCRWGDGSDIYCYESDYGYEVHLRGRRLSAEAPRYCGPPEGALDFIFDRSDSDYEDVPEYLDETDWTFRNAEQCYKFLATLRKAGYSVPDYAILALLEESLDE